MPQIRKPSPSIQFIGLILLALTGCAPTAMVAPAAIAPTVVATNTAARAPVPAAALPDEITVAEATAKRNAGAFILDVRTPEEWNEVHIPGATSIPLDQLETRLNEVPKDKEVVVVCRSGNRSKPGRDILKNAGFPQVTSMSGGLKEWQAANLPTVTGP
jgi:rhodanese-related sulfurtransferase